MKIFRYAVLSDVNSNLAALTAVLTDIETQGIRNILFLGDAVGYGPNPAECMDILRKLADVYLLGRMESCILSSQDIRLNKNTKKMITWTRQILCSSSDRWKWLCGLPHMYNANGIMAVHNDPRGLEYKCLLLCNVLGQESTIISDVFPLFSKILFIGDNHVPWIFTKKHGGKSAAEIGNKFHLNQEKSVVSVGSVGQPRDRDPRACYVIFSNNKIVWKRIEYDIEKTIAKIETCSELDNRFGLRLQEGI
jgi:hypothetical protein